jgi:type VI secretion system secreted protein VgrG
MTVFNVSSAARSENAREHYVQSWIERVSTGCEAIVTRRDFDFEKPERPLEAVVTAADRHAADKLAVYEYRVESRYRGRRNAKQVAMSCGPRADRITAIAGCGLLCGTNVKLIGASAGRLYIVYVMFAHSTAYGGILPHGGRRGEQSYIVLVERYRDDAMARASTRAPSVYGSNGNRLGSGRVEESFHDDYGR